MNLFQQKFQSEEKLDDEIVLLLIGWQRVQRFFLVVEKEINCMLVIPVYRYIDLRQCPVKWGMLRNKSSRQSVVATGSDNLISGCRTA